MARVAMAGAPALASLTCLLVGGCAAVTPRLPAPLPDNAVSVGAFAGGGGGWAVPYGGRVGASAALLF